MLPGHLSQRFDYLQYAGKSNHIICCYEFIPSGILGVDLQYAGNLSPLFRHTLPRNYFLGCIWTWFYQGQSISKLLHSMSSPKSHLRPFHRGLIIYSMRVVFRPFSETCLEFTFTGVSWNWGNPGRISKLQIQFARRKSYLAPLHRGVYK